MTDQGKNLEKAIKEFIAYIGEDTSRDGLLETPKRFVKQFLESTVGYRDDPEKHLKIFASESDRDLVTVKDITFSSLCEHHLVPFFGTIDISYVPNGTILGLSKFARVIDAYSKRLQVQERLTQQISDLLEEHLQPKFLVVRVAAKHTCMSSRGVKRHRSTTITTAVRGDIDAYAKVLSIAESKPL
jgi:GTP cyclohydrolase I